MAKGKDKSKTNKKCSSCSLDCTVSRAIAVVNVPSSKKDEVLKGMYSEAKPKYNKENCPKM